MSKNTSFREKAGDSDAVDDMNMLSDSLGGRCTLCGKSATMKCNQCVVLYCSIQCQRSELQKHALRCKGHWFDLIADDDAVGEHVSQFSGKVNVKSMQKVQNDLGVEHATESFEEVQSYPQPPYNDSLVAITSFRSPNCVFVRSLILDDTTEYANILRKIHQYGRNAKPLQKCPSVGDHVITLYNGVMRRGRITYGNQISYIRIELTDVGVLVTRHMRDLLEISRELVELPQYAVLMRLSGVPNHEHLNKELESFLQKQTNIYRIQYVGSVTPVDHIKLTDEATGNILNEQLKHRVPAMAERHYALKSLEDPEVDESQPILEPPFETVLMVEGYTDVHVKVVSNGSIDSGFIGCVPQKYYFEFKLLEQTITEMKFEGKPDYNPVLNEYCMAKLYGAWSRAMVVKIEKSKFTVLYLDYASTAIVETYQIRRYPKKLGLRCTTNLCQLEGCHELSAKQVYRLNSHFNIGTKFVIDHVKSRNVGKYQPIHLIKYRHLTKLFNE